MYKCPNCGCSKFIVAEDVSIEHLLFIDSKTVECSDCHTIIGIITPGVQDLTSNIERLEERIETLERAVKQ